MRFALSNNRTEGASCGAYPFFGASTTQSGDVESTGLGEHTRRARDRSPTGVSGPPKFSLGKRLRLSPRIGHTRMNVRCTRSEGTHCEGRKGSHPSFCLCRKRARISLMKWATLPGIVMHQDIPHPQVCRKGVVDVWATIAYSMAGSGTMLRRFLVYLLPMLAIRSLSFWLWPRECSCGC